MCPYCKQTSRIIKNGTFSRSNSPKKIQRYCCLDCGKGYSEQTTRLDYRWRKRKINQVIFRLLSKGCSQRGCAQVLGVSPQTVARRVVKFGQVSEAKLNWERKTGPKCEEVLFDEMESFEHTKLKPLTIPIAVEKKTRRILALAVGKIAAKGHLAALSKEKYGPRKCERAKVLNYFFKQIKEFLGPQSKVISDESPHYKRYTSTLLKGTPHIRYKGSRGSIVGQGELKKKAFDPLFQLNHSYAMIRDNIKRLTRRTWCTTKVIERLKNMLFIYANYHNQIIAGVNRPKIENVPN